MIVCIGVWVLFQGVGVLLSSKKNITSPLVLLSPSQSPVSLAHAINQTLTNTDGQYGIVVKNLQTGEHFAQLEHTSFDAASLYKLWVMAVVYEQISTNRLREDQKLKEDVVTLNEKFDIASESAELTEGEIELTVEEALEKMITVSDNYAAFLLVAKVRLATIASFLKTNGFLESKVGTSGGSPVSTASDIALFFEKLYRGQLGTTEATEKMIALLKRQRLNGKLPKHLPEETVIVHKTGELDQFSHDAGIVYAPAGAYIIAVLSKTSDRVEADEQIAYVSKAVFEYFSK
ncbi:MAG: serine hydrolase [Candidatus Levybacteria bacterium]|nr:serine hydrolase [Candidatus Levybacteria bacterium]